MLLEGCDNVLLTFRFREQRLNPRRWGPFQSSLKNGSGWEYFT
jgi:hypothetical protein